MWRINTSALRSNSLRTPCLATEEDAACVYRCSMGKQSGPARNTPSLLLDPFAAETSPEGLTLAHFSA
jgi:hypothetical protein